MNKDRIENGMIKPASLPQALAALALLGMIAGAPASAGLSNANPEKSPAAGEPPKTDAAAPAVDPAVALRKTARAKLIGLVADSALEIPPANLPEDLKSREQLQEFLDDPARKANDVPAIIRGSLELLTRYEPNDDFSNRLWRTAAMIDFWQRSTGSDQMSRLLDGMIDLCATFPKDDRANYQGALVKASLLNRRKDLDGSGAILAELKDRKGLPADFHIQVVSLLGDNAAARHDYAAALANWESLADESTSPFAVQALVSAVFLHLDQGKRDEAYKMLEALRQFSPEVIKANPVGGQAEELLALSKDHAESDAYWDAQAKWWPVWMTVDRKLGPEPDAAAMEVPLIPNLPQLGGIIGRAAQQGDTAERAKGLRRIAQASRWEPSMLVELTELLVSLNPLQLANAVGEYRNFVISAYENAKIKDPARRRPLCCMAASAYIDSRENEKAQTALREFASLPGVEDNVSQIASRLAAIAAMNTGKGIEEAAAAGEKALESDAYQYFRPQGVVLLTHLYERLGKDKEALALLDREIKRSAGGVKDEGLRMLENRRDVLMNKSATAKLSVGAKAWLDEIRLPWLDYSRPHALNEAGVGDLDQALTLGISALTPCEQTKLAALVALDDSQPEKRQFNAVWVLGFYSCAFAPDSETAARWAKSFLASKDIAMAFKEAYFAGSALRAFSEDDDALFQALVTDPIRGKLSEQQESFATDATSYFEALKGGDEACFRLAESLIRKPFTGVSRDVFQHLFGRLSASGNFTRASNLIAALAAMPQSLDPDNAKSAMQLALIKTLSRDKKWRPVNEALRDVALARFGKDAPANAPTAPSSDYRLFSLNESAEAALPIRLAAIRAGHFTAQSDYFWIEFMRDLDRSPENFKMRTDGLRAALESAKDDEVRADVVHMVISVMDIDSSEERAAAEEILKPYRKGDEQSKTADAVRSYDFSLALRIGASIDVKAALATIKEDNSKRVAEATALNYGIAASDKALLKFLVDSISPQELLSDRMVQLALPAYRLLGMKDEATLVEQSSKEAIYRLILEFWMSGNDSSILNAYQTADLLGDESLIPSAVSASVIGSRRNELTRLSMDSEDALYRHDWERAVKVCAQALHSYPSYYHFYFIQGKAQAALNHRDEAIHSLQSYVATVHDESDVKDAKELIQKLTGEGGKQAETK